MSKKEELVPELRFPEFQNGDHWRLLPLYEVCDINPSVKQLPERFVYIDLDSVENGVLLKKKIITLKDAPSRAQRLLQVGDVIFQMVRPYQKNNLFFQPNDHLDYVASTGYAQLRARQSSRYLFQYLHNQNFVDKVMEKSTGSSYPAINSSDLAQILVEVPALPEQQKIASCLSSLDDSIAAHKAKQDVLKDHKKGLMQNLFPQEGETVPKYRFPEFENDGEWVEKKLGDIADFFNGRAYQQDELLSKGKYRILRVGNLFTNNEWYYSNLELDEDKYCENGDLLYAWSASFGPHMWKEDKTIYHYHIWKVKNKTGIDKQFLFNVLDYETLRMKSKSLNGFALMHITKGAVEEWKSLIPNNEKEQQKIALCLSALDELITAQGSKVKQLKLHKKGLMQSLFPI